MQAYIHVIQRGVDRSYRATNPQKRAIERKKKAERKRSHGQLSNEMVCSGARCESRALGRQIYVPINTNKTTFSQYDRSESVEEYGLKNLRHSCRRVIQDGAAESASRTVAFAHDYETNTYSGFVDT